MFNFKHLNKNKYKANRFVRNSVIQNRKKSFLRELLFEHGKIAKDFNLAIFMIFSFTPQKNHKIQHSFTGSVGVFCFSLAGVWIPGSLRPVGFADLGHNMK